MTTNKDIICYWNNGMSFRSVAYDYSAQSGEVVFININPPHTATPEQLAVAFPNYNSSAAAATKAAFNAPIFAQIDALEATTARALRDVALGKGNIQSGSDHKTPIQRLADIESQIAALRSTLQ